MSEEKNEKRNQLYENPKPFYPLDLSWNRCNRHAVCWHSLRLVHLKFPFSTDFGWGASALILGNVANALFQSSIGWRKTYMLLGIAIGIVLIITALLLKKPSADTVFPQPKTIKTSSSETFERCDFSSGQMLRRPSFGMAFICISFLAAVGSSVISFAKDLALSVNASESLAVTLVGILSVCNGIGRILTGAMFDSIGRRKTMLSANILNVTFTYCGGIGNEYFDSKTIK